MNGAKNKEILFEIIPHGNVMKVIAIDPETGTEVITQGPLSASETILKQAAARKLLYVLNKKKEK